MKIKLITDSAADLSKDMIKKYDIEVVPLKIIFGDEEFIDGVTISNKEFYDKLEAGIHHPKTSQVNQFEFEEVFKKYDSDTAIILTTLSSDLSGTYQSAMNAKMAVGRDNIYIFDTRSVSIGQGAITWEIARLIQNGTDFETIQKEIPKLIKNLRVYATFETLKFLKAGGRMSGMLATIGEVLKLKVILTTRNGLVMSDEKVIGTKKAFKTLKNHLSEEADKSRAIYYGIADKPEMKAEYVDTFNDEIKINNFEIFDIGPTVGTHVGRGAFGVTFFVK